MDKPVIRIKNITKKFPGVKALDDVSLDIYPGEVHVLIGEMVQVNRHCSK